MKPKTKKQRVEAEIVVSTSLCQPAARIVLLYADANRTQDGDYRVARLTFPILAIRSTVVDIYSKVVPEDSYPDGEQNHAEMILMEWRFDSRVIREELLIWNQDVGVVPIEEMDAANAATNLVFCNWPHSGDQVEFARLFVDVMSEAVNNARGDDAEQTVTPQAEPVASQ